MKKLFTSKNVESWLKCSTVMGGLQSLVTFFIIKMKIALIAATVIGAVALALKVFGFFKYSGYFFKNDYASIGLPLSEFHGYPLPPPPTEIDHDQHETYGNDWSSYSEHYARSGSVSETLPKRYSNELIDRCIAFVFHILHDKFFYKTDVGRIFMLILS